MLVLVWAWMSVCVYLCVCECEWVCVSVWVCVYVVVGFSCIVGKSGGSLQCCGDCAGALGVFVQCCVDCEGAHCCGEVLVFLCSVAGIVQALWVFCAALRGM